ncbi:cytochrome P450 [Heliocybe sulcata]|uniref:Cytochrome P450 n=1 Tax=Heliocybe sulcata TaxID=5364 RepID=A0A5C3NEB2_9AGAM|nr:cytochrome P450 [Heliocybe sulcata]
MGAALSQSTLLGFALGILSHRLLFIRGEWERHVVPIFYAVLSLPFLLFPVQLASGGRPVLGSIAATVAWIASYYAGLFASMLTYRAFFHPLRSYPGPFLARLSSFWSLWHQIPGFKWYEQVQDLHRRYGDFVRIRPRELSINHPDAVQAIHGPRSVCTKSPYYDLYYPHRSLQLTRDKPLHAQRRRVWDRGLGERALREYEPRVLKHCTGLCSELLAQAGSATDVTPWFNHWALDVIGDIGFGQSFNMVKSEGASQPMLKEIAEVKSVQAVIGTVPWLYSLALVFPMVRKERDKWFRWCKQQLSTRRERKGDFSDIFAHLVDEESRRANDPDVAENSLVYDVELATLAGSDTVSATLGNAIYLLATHPKDLAVLQAEIDALFATVSDFDHKQLVGQPMLEGVINEALRLFPVVPSGFPRLTPPEGMVIAGQWVPGDTVVSTPTYTIFRDPRCFASPNEFLPQRWSSEPELVHRKDAFVPFSTGVYSCVGKQLAMMELRLMIALVVKQFNIQLADDRVHHAFLEEPGHMDFVTVEMPPLRLILTSRG